MYIEKDTSPIFFNAFDRGLSNLSRYDRLIARTKKLIEDSIGIMNPLNPDLNSPFNRKQLMTEKTTPITVPIKPILGLLSRRYAYMPIIKTLN